MKFIKISLLSITILILGIFGVTFGSTLLSNNSSSFGDIRYEKNLKNNEDNSTTVATLIDSSIKLDENFLTNKEVILFAEWFVPIGTDFPENPTAYIQLWTNENNGDSYGPDKDVKILLDAPDETGFSFTSEKDNTDIYFTINATINSGNWFSYDDDNDDNDWGHFIPDTEHIFIIRIDDAFGNYEDFPNNLNGALLTFTVPSKSVISFTETTGDIKSMEEESVVIDTSWVQESQVVTDKDYLIDENLQLTLDTGDFKGEISIDTTKDSIEVTGLTEFTTYNWNIYGNYYNGVDTIEILPFDVEILGGNDSYSWVTPVNITLFIIIIIEVIASAVLFRLLFMHTRDKASL